MKKEEGEAGTEAGTSEHFDRKRKTNDKVCLFLLLRTHLRTHLYFVYL